MRYIIYFLIALFGATLFLAVLLQKEVDTIKSASEKVYKDNKVLLEMFEVQNKGYNTLINNGWSKERADAFIADGCLMSLEVGE